MSPSSARNSARSASSSCAISASIAAHTGTTTAPSAAARFSTRCQQRVVGEALLVHVGHVHHGLRGEQLQLAQVAALLLGERQGAHRLDRIQLHLDALEQTRACAAASLSPLLAALAARSRPFSTVAKIRQRQLGVDDLDIGERIDAAGDVHDVGALEAAHHVRDGIHLADVRQKLVAQPLALRSAGDQTCDVDELDRGRNDLLRFAIAASCCRRGSGTGTTPTLGSMVQNG